MIISRETLSTSVGHPLGVEKFFEKKFCEQMRGTPRRVKECKSSTDERSTTWACTVETTMLLSNAAARLKLGACETMPLPDSRAVRQRETIGGSTSGLTHFSAAPAAFLLDTMAAPPHEWVSDGAPTLPCIQRRAAARLL